MSFLPTAGLLLGGLGSAAGSLFGGRKQPTPQDLERMFGTGAFAKRKNELFNLMVNSPSFRAALSNTNLAGQRLGQNINTNLARSGLLNSGIGAVGQAAGESAGGFGVQQLVGQADTAAGDQAQQLNQLLASLFGHTQGPTALQTGSGALLGALGPLFASYFQNKRPAGAQ